MTTRDQFNSYKTAIVSKIDNGQLTLSFAGAWVGRNGSESGHGDGLRLQFYWPHGYYKHRPDQRDHRDFFLTAPTNFRVTCEHGYWGIGFNLLGFGCAADWQN